MMTKFRILGIAALAGAAWLAAEMIPSSPVASSALAQAGEPTTLQQLLGRVRQQRGLERRENQQRLEEFRRRAGEQQALLNRAIADLAAEEQLSDELAARFEANDLALEEAEKELNERLGAFKELFGTVRQVSGEMRADVQQSMVSAEYPDRDQALDALARVRGLPTTKQLEDLWFIMQQEMTAQGEVSRFTATVYEPDGIPGEQEVVRVGPFTAVSGGEFLAYEADEQTESQSLRLLERQPTARLLAAARRLQNADAGTIVDAPVDPSRGQLLTLLIDFPTITERVQQGRLIGYIIIAVGVLGALLALWRIVVLTGVSGAVAGQARNPDNPKKGNPLGRILMVAQEQSGADVETLELKLDEAIIKEVPKLETGLNIIKVVAAAAPLLGLLGTVTGMIQVFQTITLFGAGDPKLMAGGISQALVTTVLGLVVAIPMLLLHTFAAGRARNVTQVLEEQAAGIIAQRAERG